MGRANQSEVLVVVAEVHWIVLAEEVPIAVKVGWDERSELECHFGGVRWLDLEREGWVRVSEV